MATFLLHILHISDGFFLVPTFLNLSNDGTLPHFDLRENVQPHFLNRKLALRGKTQPYLAWTMPPSFSRLLSPLNTQEQKAAFLHRINCTFVLLPIYGDSSDCESRNECDANRNHPWHLTHELEFWPHPTLVNDFDQSHWGRDTAQKQIADGKIDDENIVNLKRNKKKQRFESFRGENIDLYVVSFYVVARLT